MKAFLLFSKEKQFRRRSGGLVYGQNRERKNGYFQGYG